MRTFFVIFFFFTFFFIFLYLTIEWFTGAFVLDVGCAYGRYALPFAAAAKDVTAADISPRMLELCAEQAGEKGLSNLETLKHDWKKDELGGLKGRFDLVFACMCTPARTSAGLEKMTAASRRHCVVASH